MIQCYCGSNKPFTDCCEPIINGQCRAKKAEQLMRSRYSAYVVADINYLLNSHHKLTRPTKDRKSILKWAKSVNWLKLEVLKIEKGLAYDTEGYVEFKAFYEEKGKVECMHENSYFEKESNLWFYKSGVHK